MVSGGAVGRAASPVHDASGVGTPAHQQGHHRHPAGRAEHGPDQRGQRCRTGGGQRALPLVVLSPGFTNSRSTLTALAEDLASHGYVVAGIDRTYESFATAFPDGRVTTGLAREAPRRGPGFWEKVVTGRAADVSFVLGELTGAHQAWPGAGLIDPSRMAMAGHSPAAQPPSPPCWPTPGSAPASTWTARLTPGSRITACHGRFSSWASNRTTPGSEGAVTTWERDWKRLTGWKRWLLVAGAIHASFTDLGLLADQIGIDVGAGLPGARSLDITRAYVRAFFDQHLRGKPQILLDQPSPRYPESRSVPRRRNPVRSTSAGRAGQVAADLVHRRPSGTSLVADTVERLARSADEQQIGPLPFWPVRHRHGRRASEASGGSGDQDGSRADLTHRATRPPRPLSAPVISVGVSCVHQPSSPSSSWNVPVGPSLPIVAIRTMFRALTSTGRPPEFCTPPSSVAV